MSLISKTYFVHVIFINSIHIKHAYLQKYIKTITKNKLAKCLERYTMYIHHTSPSYTISTTFITVSWPLARIRHINSTNSILALSRHLAYSNAIYYLIYAAWSLNLSHRSLPSRTNSTSFHRCIFSSSSMARIWSNKLQIFINH
jgi:hypothetical protein